MSAPLARQLAAGSLLDFQVATGAVNAQNSVAFGEFLTGARCLELTPQKKRNITAKKNAVAHTSTCITACV